MAQFTKAKRPGRTGLVLALVLAATVAGPVMLYRYGGDRGSEGAAQSEEKEALLALRQLAAELRDLAKALPSQRVLGVGRGTGGGGDGGRGLLEQWEELKVQFTGLRTDLEKRVAQLEEVQGGLNGLARDVREEIAAQQAARFHPLDRIGGEPVAIAQVSQEGLYLASPSIVRLRSGRLLAVYERSWSWGSGEETLHKVVVASEDGGATWQEVARVGPMNWPQIFRCKLGVYIIGVQRHFSHNNNLVISRMLSPDGHKWSEVKQLTEGWSVVAANTGVDVSGGRVTKTFELIPSMAVPLTTTVLTKEVTLPIQGGPEGPSWVHQPVVEVEVAETRGFIQYTLAKAPRGGKALFFRILHVRPAERVLVLRLERFNLYWQRQPVTLGMNSTLEVASGANVYGGVDWVAMAMSADEESDLTDPRSWAFLDTPLGNPASVYSNEMRALFDVAFRADQEVRKSIIGFDVPELQKDPATAWEAGFGSVYWMEGVATRLQDRHGGNGKLLSIMRVNNDLLCDLAAVVELDDSKAGNLTGRFLRYTFVPGLGVGHPAILYDPLTDLYWMASNVNRDSTRHWKQPDKPTDANPNLHITAFSKCEVDRSTLALFYSPNLLSWVMAGVIDYHMGLNRHFAYPHMILDGPDLLVVSRASFKPGDRSRAAGLPQMYNNHNSNAVALHRVRNFRHYANVEWAHEQGVYSQHPRRTTGEQGQGRPPKPQQQAPQEEPQKEQPPAGQQAQQHAEQAQQHAEQAQQAQREVGAAGGAQPAEKEQQQAEQAQQAQSVQSAEALLRLEVHHPLQGSRLEAIRQWREQQQQRVQSGSAGKAQQEGQGAAAQHA